VFQKSGMCQDTIPSSRGYGVQMEEVENPNQENLGACTCYLFRRETPAGTDELWPVFGGIAHFSPISRLFHEVPGFPEDLSGFRAQGSGAL
jgi:hypothetical protein